MATKRKPAAPKAPVAPAAPPMAEPATGMAFEVTGCDRQIEVEGGVMLAGAGYYIVTDGSVISAMPPERFFEAYPDQKPEDEA
jgi:hypothetical protein